MSEVKYQIMVKCSIYLYRNMDLRSYHSALVSFLLQSSKSSFAAFLWVLFCVCDWHCQCRLLPPDLSTAFVVDGKAYGKNSCHSLATSYHVEIFTQSVQDLWFLIDLIFVCKLSGLKLTNNIVSPVKSDFFLAWVELFISSGSSLMICRSLTAPGFSDAVWLEDGVLHAKCTIDRLWIYMIFKFCHIDSQNDLSQ